MAFTENILARGYRLWPRLGLEAVVSVIPQSRTYLELSLLWPHIKSTESTGTKPVLKNGLLVALVKRLHPSCASQ